ncbi:MAG: hypothetical protein E7I93_05460 [Clostridium perfringens]|nr:hypothetical protein [Clostridium perfringens]
MKKTVKVVGAIIENEKKEILCALRSKDMTLLVNGTPKASEHAKLIWLPVDYLETLSWAPADVPAVKQLVSEK